MCAWACPYMYNIHCICILSRLRSQPTSLGAPNMWPDLAVQFQKGMLAVLLQVADRHSLRGCRPLGTLEQELSLWVASLGPGALGPIDKLRLHQQAPGGANSEMTARRVASACVEHVRDQCLLELGAADDAGHAPEALQKACKLCGVKLDSYAKHVLTVPSPYALATARHVLDMQRHVQRARNNFVQLLNE